MLSIATVGMEMYALNSPANTVSLHYSS